jgi:hypothetical protein
MEINFKLISSDFYQKIQPQIGRLGEHIVNVINSGSKLAVSHPFASLITANIILCETGIRISRLIGELGNAFFPYHVASQRQKDIIFWSFITGGPLYMITANYLFITTFKVPLTPLVAVFVAVGTSFPYIYGRATYN